MATTSLASSPTSLKLPAALKTQLEINAQDAGISLHAFMVQALADSVHRTRLRQAFVQDAQTALDGMKASGLGHELGDVRTYFAELSRHRKGVQTKPQDLSPTPLG